MSTSGTIAYTLTARDLIMFALHKIRVIGEAENPSAADTQLALRSLNLLLKTLQMRAPGLWRQTDGSVALVAGTVSYTLSPMPYRVEECRYRSASSIDLPMFELTRQDYKDLPLKTSQGVPTTFYVDYQRASTVLYVWPVPASVSTETIQYTYQRKTQDVSTLEDDLDIPQEHLETVGFILADRMLDDFGKDMPRITARAAELLNLVEASDREPVVRFIPERRI